MSVGKLLPQAGSLFQGTWVKAGSDNVVNEDIDVVVMRLVKVVMGSWRMMVLWVTMVWNLQMYCEEVESLGSQGLW